MIALCHLTGQNRRAEHQSCELIKKKRQPCFVIVDFHKFTSYKSHKFIKLI